MDRLYNNYRNLHPKKRFKIGWIETHYYQKELLRKSYACVVVIGDSIVAGLRRYPTVWVNSILQYKTGGDRIDGLHLFGFRKLARMRVNMAGKKQGKHKLCQIKPSLSNSESLGRVRILFRFRKWR